MSEESFFKRVSWLNDLKLRASYGQTGNNDIGNYSYVGRIKVGSANDYVLNNTLASGRTLNTLGNPDLGWEKTSEVNVGLDSGAVQQPRSRSPPTPTTASRRTCC